jgi:dipeptidyl aminopeptidase/acylaminoacyl peptidase
VRPDGPARFPDSEEAFKLSFALSGYAVLDDVSMPVVGNADDANDTFLEQIIANAEAAVAAAARTGLADPERVGIAGHSYGAFMVANLLAHTDLFAAGIAMSGSYNRTLTPFGFQTERRSLWQARDTYLEMSPLLYSDQIGSPLLLVHGALDDNPGTAPTQSQQLYDAIRHNGGEARLLLLPYEGHSYRARASVHLTARVMLGWLENHLRPRSPVEGLATAAVDTPPLGF